MPLLSVWALVGLILVQPALAGDRVALVIGNNAYRTASPLLNPVNDATQVAQRLTSAGWKVHQTTDANARQMRSALRTFCEAEAGADAALVFYAGHGMEIKDRNYLLPLDAVLETEDDVAAEAISLNDVLERLNEASMRLKIVVLDCCRDNPLRTRSWLAQRGGAGLAEVKPESLPTGTLLVFSTAPGKTAPDGSGRNSPFTSALLAELEAGGAALDLFARVSERARDSEPWVRLDSSGKSLAAFNSLQIGAGLRVRPARQALEPARRENGQGSAGNPPMAMPKTAAELALDAEDGAVGKLHTDSLGGPILCAMLLRNASRRPISYQLQSETGWRTYQLAPGAERLVTDDFGCQLRVMQDGRFRSVKKTVYAQPYLSRSQINLDQIRQAVAQRKVVLNIDSEGDVHVE